MSNLTRRKKTSTTFTIVVGGTDFAVHMAAEIIGAVATALEQQRGMGMVHLFRGRNQDIPLKHIKKGDKNV